MLKVSKDDYCTEELTEYSAIQNMDATSSFTECTHNSAVESTNSADAQHSAYARISNFIFDSSKKYPPPDGTKFEYNESMGYFFDPTTSLFYDPSTKYFFSAMTKEILRYDVYQSMYVSLLEYSKSLEIQERVRENDELHDVDDARKVILKMEEWENVLQQQITEKSKEKNMHRYHKDDNCLVNFIEYSDIQNMHAASSFAASTPNSMVKSASLSNAQCLADFKISNIIFDSSKKYPPPDGTKFEYNESMGYFFDPTTSLFYDPNTKHFFSAITKDILRYDAYQSMYVSLLEYSKSMEIQERVRENDEIHDVDDARKIILKMEEWENVLQQQITEKSKEKDLRNASEDDYCPAEYSAVKNMNATSSFTECTSNSAVESTYSADSEHSAGVKTSNLIFDSSKKYPPPDGTKFEYNESMGYFFDPSTSLFYDPNTKYFFSAVTKDILRYDAYQSMYVSLLEYSKSMEIQERARENDELHDVDDARKVILKMEEWENVLQQQIMEKSKELGKTCVDKSKSETDSMGSSDPNYLNNDETPIIIIFDSSKQYPAPDCTKFEYDDAMGYYFDNTTGLYYDPSTKYFFSAQTKEILKYDSCKRMYVSLLEYSKSLEIQEKVKENG